MQSRREINKVVVPYIVVNGFTFFLMLAFGKTGEKGLLTFTNLFNFTIVLTMISFGFFSLSHSIRILKEFYKNGRVSLAVGQLIISITIFLGASGFIWVLVESILKNWKG